MKLYIDKENITSLLNAPDSRIKRNCIRLMVEQLSVYYNCSKNDIANDEILSDVFLWYADAIESDPKPYYANSQNEIIPPRENLKTNFYKESDSYMRSIFLLNAPRICDYLSPMNCIAIGKVGEEIAVLKKFLEMDVEVVTLKEIKEWKYFIPQIPTSEIIICDDHYFKQFYKENNNELISSLTSAQKNTEIKILIITKEKEVDSAISLAEEQKRINTELSNRIGKKCQVCIVTTYRTHDRNIITNYYRIKHGSCFHLKNSGLKEDVTTNLKMSSFMSNESLVNKLLKTYKDIFNNPSKKYGPKDFNLCIWN